MNLSTHTLIVSAAASVLAIGISQSNSFAATTIVDDFGDGGWTNGDTRDGAGVNVAPAGRVDLDITAPAASPSGYNSLRLTTDTGSSKATLHQSGISLGGLVDFSGSYNWYKENAGAPAPAFKLGIDTSDANPASTRPGEALFDKFLIYEPYDNPDSADPGTNVWVSQSFDQTNGTWWLVDRTAGNLQVNPPHSSLTLQGWLSHGTYARSWAAEPSSRRSSAPDRAIQASSRMWIRFRTPTAHPTSAKPTTSATSRNPRVLP